MNIKFALAALSLAASGLAHSATIDWNSWSSNSTGSITTPSGPIGVTYAGQMQGFYATYPSWGPSTTFADGTIVANGPSTTSGIIYLTGGNATVDSVTFSQAVVNPVFAIWSLGQPGVQASFHFLNATPTFVAGGGSNEYGGSPITVSGNDVFGSEGNGTVQFMGTFTTITWTNPSYEGWYGFDVGIAGLAAAVPEPGSTGLMLAGLALAGLAMRRKLR